MKTREPLVDRLLFGTVRSTIPKATYDRNLKKETINSELIQRPVAQGKFLFVDKEKFMIRGVTYGTFKPDVHGIDYPTEETVRRDFAMMVSNHINSVRVYTVPPVWFLDLAQEYRLRIMIGLPWEQHITFLDSKRIQKNIRDEIRTKVKSCTLHPAVLCYAIGNEIPSSIVRWYGPKRIEAFLKSLYSTVKLEDPDSLVTYVNFPPTEYLQLPFLDLLCFNVYLEKRDRLSAYLGRLQNLTGDKPLILSEIGLDSLRNGQEQQAAVLDWQIRSAFSKGAAGTFVFSWTDEWFRGGLPILDWDFGLTDRERKPKTALTSIRNIYGNDRLLLSDHWPFFTVAVCTYNGASTLHECLDSLAKLDYPNYEVVVVNDGSTDNTAHIAQSFDCRLISTTNQGLSNARNTAYKVARGEIVAYIDDDAHADRHWLQYLAITFLETGLVAVGGPNIPPTDEDLVATCVAHAPGGPSHVLLSDQEAEHIPGCNMAFRKEALEAVGGFNPCYRSAGDDVDICWRIQEQGWKIAFSPAATVWHRRRSSISAYWKQQKGYGKAEALLETQWPQKFNSLGHMHWGGRLYGSPIMRPLGHFRSKIEYGTWGTGLFQSLYEREPPKLFWTLLLPEWYMLVGFLIGLSLLGFFWRPLFLAAPLALIFLAILVIQAVRSTYSITFQGFGRFGPLAVLKLRLVTSLLYFLQPLARLMGRLAHGLTWWRRRHERSWAWPQSCYHQIWNERQWKNTKHWLTKLESKLINQGVLVRRGGPFDKWDLEVKEGLSVPNRILMTIEEHGQGKQLVRFRIWSCYNWINVLPVVLFLFLSILATLDKAWIAATVLIAIAIVFGKYSLRDRRSLITSCLAEIESNTYETVESIS